jgi:hypothetical protein
MGYAKSRKTVRGARAVSPSLRGSRRFTLFDANLIIRRFYSVLSGVAFSRERKHCHHPNGVGMRGDPLSTHVDASKRSVREKQEGAIKGSVE